MVREITRGETPSAIFATINSRLRTDPQRTAGRHAVYAFDLGGDGGGDFHIVLADGSGSAGEGAPPNPDLTLAMTASDFVEMTLGRLDGTLAFIDGRITITGDTRLALDLTAVFAAEPQPPG